MIGIATSGFDDAGLECAGQIAPADKSRFLAIGLVSIGLWLTPAFAAAGDALRVTDVRVRKFLREAHTVDRGEGAAMRPVKSIPIPENKTIELKPDGYLVMLLQTRQKLVPGEKFTCAITFQKAGTKETEVQVSQMP